MGFLLVKIAKKKQAKKKRRNRIKKILKGIIQKYFLN